MADQPPIAKPTETLTRFSDRPITSRRLRFVHLAYAFVPLALAFGFVFAAKSVPGLTSGFFALLLLGGVGKAGWKIRSKFRTRRYLATQTDESLIEHNERSSALLVEVTIRERPFNVFRDRGAVEFEDGAITFSGSETSFVVPFGVIKRPTILVEALDKGRGYDCYLSVTTDRRILNFVPLDGADDPGCLKAAARFVRLKDELNEFIYEQTVAFMPGLRKMRRGPVIESDEQVR